MNWSWSNTTQASPGFVYFNNSDPNNQNFIPFNDSPTPQQNKFGPQGYSTPQQQRRSYYNQQRNWNQNRFSGRNRSFSSPNETKQQFDNNYLIKTKFVHKSFLENPWEALERKLQDKRTYSKENCDDSTNSQIDTSGQKRSIDMLDL